MKEIEDILPVETITAKYSNISYKTVTKLSIRHPLEETVERWSKKERAVYICAGSQMVLGGNADQGLSVTESALYLTSTYSIALSKVLHAYPLTLKQAIICPNVLVFKDMNYQNLTIDNYQKIAVICAPNKSNATVTGDIYSQETKLKSAEIYKEAINSLVGALETALFFGYDSVIIDDRAVDDNKFPVYLAAAVIKHAIGLYKGRFKEIVIAVPKREVFEIFRNQMG
jgi:hypothetical protein